MGEGHTLMGEWVPCWGRGHVDGGVGTLLGEGTP